MKKIGYLIILDKLEVMHPLKVDFLEFFKEEGKAIYDRIEVVFVYGSNQEEVQALIVERYHELAKLENRSEKEDRALIEAEALLPHLGSEETFSPIPPSVYDWCEDKFEVSKLLFVHTERNE